MDQQENSVAQDINSRYQILSLIGRGGMGAVYRARDRLSGEIVALKRVFLLEEQPPGDRYVGSPLENQLRLALAHEFEVLASLRHPHIISVLDYGFDTAGQPFFTMTYLPAAQTVLDAARAAPYEARVILLQQILLALIYLHRRGILHRDLKPANVLVDDNAVRVLDFGLAAAVEEATQSAGSWAYAAPEIIDGQRASELTDLYAVGVIAYEIFAGRHPFNPDSPDFIDQALEEEPDLTALDVPAPLRALIGRLLAKWPHERYESARAALDALLAATGSSLPRESQAVRDSFLQASRFVGRDSFLNEIGAAFSNAQTGRGSAWLVGGESGVGKTRFLDEIRVRALVDGALVVRARGVEDAIGQPYRLWGDVLRRMVLAREPNALTASVLEPLVPDISLLLNRPVAPPSQLSDSAARQRLISTIRDLFRQTPRWTVLLLDDLQWASDSLDILDQLLRSIEEMPLVIVAAYRSDEAGYMPERLPRMQLLTLPRFTTDEIAHLSEGMLGQGGAQPHVIARLQEESEGNAFFLVETVRALAASAGELRAVGTMTLPDRVFPEGIESIVQRRLARVPASSRLLLDAIAVAGREIDVSVANVIATALDLPQSLEGWLAGCADATVLDIVDGTWRFAHEKLRQGVLATIPPDDQRGWHLDLAQITEQIYGSAPEWAGTLARHWRAVGDDAEELRHTLNAAAFAERQFAHEEALSFYDRALALTPAASLVQRFNILMARELIHGVLGNRDRQLADLSTLQTLARRLGDETGTDRRAAIALRLADFATATGDFAEAATAAREAVALAGAGEQQQIRAEGYLTWAKALLRQGDQTQADEILQQGLDLARKAGLDGVVADALRYRGIIATERRQFTAAADFCRAALPLYQSAGDLYGESNAYINLGNAVYALGDDVAALEAWEAARRLLQRSGDRAGSARVLVNLGAAYVDLGLFDDARRASAEALQICRDIDVRLGTCFSLLNLGLAHHYQGDNAAGEQYARDAHHIAEQMGARPHQAFALLNLGHALLAQSRTDAAAEAFTAARTILSELDIPAQGMAAAAGLAACALQRNDPAQALRLIAPVLDFLDKDNALDGVERPLRVPWIAQQVLDAAGQVERAQALRTRTRQQLADRARQIADTGYRRTFLDNVPLHRQIRLQS